jgi:Sporulation and spore germination
MSRNLKIAFAILAVAVVVGALSLRGLRERVERLAQAQIAEEHARKEVLSKPISTPTDVNVKAKIFWAAGADGLAPVEIDLPLSADPVQRSRQLIQALVSNPPSLDQRTLPADTTLLAFYRLPDGTAIADFSYAISSEMPSGILSEQMAVNSVAQTLAANVPGLSRLKILIHGQEVDTLAGHVDLTGFFDLASLVQAPSATQPLLQPAAPLATAPSGPSGAPKVGAAGGATATHLID